MEPCGGEEPWGGLDGVTWRGTRGSLGNVLRWRQSRPSPKSRGEHPGHHSGLGSVCPVSYSTLWAVERGRSSPIRVRSTAQGQNQPSPSQGHTGSLDPIPCTPALGLPLCPTPHPGSTQAHGGTGVKSCPKLFLAVFQLGINGLGRRLGNASCAGPSPFVASPVSKFPLQTSIFQEFSNQPNDRCLEPGAGSSPGPQP